MNDLENKLGAIMNDPDMMEKIKSLAQNLSQGSEAATQQPPAAAIPDIDISMLQKLSGFAGKSNIDANQKNLLQALGPYLSHNRLSRLERAMRAAKMAGMATALLPQLTQGR